MYVLHFQQLMLVSLLVVWHALDLVLRTARSYLMHS